MGSAHQSIHFSGISTEKAKKKGTAGGSTALMDLLICVGLGRLLTKKLRAPISLLSFSLLTLNP